MNRSALFAVAIFLSSCGAHVPATSSVAMSQTGAHWQQWSDPAAAGFDAGALAKVCERADEVKSGAFLAAYRGSALVACGDIGRKLELHSVRKSIYAALYGVAVEKGLVRLDATVGELGIDDLQPLSESEKRARVEDLLLARSGVYHPASYAPSDQDSPPARGSKAPGTHWFYNNWDFNLAAVILERAAGKPLGVLMEEWIARPIGMEDFVAGDVTPIYEPSRSKWPALTIRMSTRDLARFGQLWLQRGSWNGRAVIPASWVDRASKLVSVTDSRGEGYGMMWWVSPPASYPPERYPVASRLHIVSGRGTGGQLLAVIPSEELVIVHRGDTDHGREVQGRHAHAMLEMVLAARQGTPRPDAKLTAVRPLPLASQLPPLEWPATIELDEETMKALVGDYRFGPDRIGRVFIHEGRLFGSLPPFGDAELSAISPTRFWIRVDPEATVLLENDRFIVRMRGREFIGERIR